MQQSVSLRPTDADPAPILVQREDAAAEDSRYHVFGEIARGGMASFPLR